MLVQTAQPSTLEQSSHGAGTPVTRQSEAPLLEKVGLLKDSEKFFKTISNPQKLGSVVVGSTKKVINEQAQGFKELNKLLDKLDQKRTNPLVKSVIKFFKNLLESSPLKLLSLLKTN